MNERNVITLLKCPRCGTLQDPTHRRCKDCRAQELSPVQCQPEGTILTYTNCNALPEGLSEKSQVTFAIVELECGGRVLAQVEPSGDVVIGTPVIGHIGQIYKYPDGTGENGYIFSPKDKKGAWA